jgi:hypothetical protein
VLPLGLSPSDSDYGSEEEVGQDYSTWDQYFEKIVVCGCLSWKATIQMNNCTKTLHS